MRGLIKINNEITEYLFDTGASQTVMNTHTFKQINTSQTTPIELKSSKQSFTSANAKINLHGQSEMSMELGNAKFDVTVNVADLNKSQTVLLGRDAINACPLFEPIMTQLEQIITESTNQIIKEYNADIPTCGEQKIRRVPYAKLEEFKKIIQDQLDAGIIEPSDSAWCSPVHLVMKPDGSIRITIDYKKLNDACIKDAYPIPHMESLYTQLTNSRFYTKIDCFNGYYQIMMDPASSDYTSFGCELGLFKYKKLAQGLANAPATFQRLIDKVFAS